MLKPVLLTLATVFFLTMPVLAAEKSGGQPTSSGAKWIWSTEKRTLGQRAFFRRTFRIQGDIQNALLCGVADFHSCLLHLNDQPIVRLVNYGPLVEIPLTDKLRPGENTLTIKASPSTGPAAVAVWLTIGYQDGAQQIIATDESWSASATGRAPWRPAHSFGRIDARRWTGTGNTASSNTGRFNIHITPLDDYTQWKQSLGEGAAAHPATFRTLPDFQIEQLRRAKKNEGSWVSMTFDPQGRLIVAKEDKGLLRMTLSHNASGVENVETINNTVKECRGLVFLHNDLYANANESKAMFRLRDVDGDGQFEQVSKLHASSGGTGHGRNDLAVGADGNIYSIHGDAVDLPQGVLDRTSPYRASRRGKRTREGHLLRLALQKDAKALHKELVAAGMRNPFGVAFNHHGEAFTYDADAEFDMGAPWYRPTRVLHLVSGADFGWRGVTGKWPPYFPNRADAAPPVLDIGKGSPTAVKFGAASKFPPAYRRALFILDWAYGRILAIHLTPRGASYACRAETFLKGRPLNVTDLDFGPDGAMYLITGGRKTQSALYRIRYQERVSDSAGGTSTPTPQQLARRRQAARDRQLRRRLEAFHGRVDSKAVEVAWPYLDSEDPFIRHAARIAIEHQPVERWRWLALSEKRTTARLTALMALARSGAGAEILGHLLDLETPLDQLDFSQWLMLLRTAAICLSQSDALEPVLANRASAFLEKAYPYSSSDLESSRRVNRELSLLLARLGSARLVPQTMRLLHHEQQPSQRLHYLFVLRSARRGWTETARESFFQALRDCRTMMGGQGMPGFISQIRKDALAALDANQRARYEEIFAEDAAHGQAATSRKKSFENRPHVRVWKTAEVLQAISKASSSKTPRSSAKERFQRGKQMFAEALCITCHRIRGAGAAHGPDLTSAAGRFSRRDLLESILAPSKVIAPPYRMIQVQTTKGKVLMGQIAPGGDYRSPVLRLIPDPLQPAKVLQIEKRDIEAHQLSPISPMPKGLLDRFHHHEIRDLLAYIESGGDPQHPVFEQ